MTTKYVLTQDYTTSDDAKKGTVVYRLAGSDYGLARDDTVATGVEHVSVTLKPDGDYPSFTYPANLLQKVVPAPQTITTIGGKQFAGRVANARPFTEQWPRCICGLLVGKDLKGRGFDNRPIRTSLVERLLLEDGNLYAITMNSAYLLVNVELDKFLLCPDWADDLDDLITQGTRPAVAKSQSAV